jgi:hypothetical protein
MQTARASAAWEGMRFSMLSKAFTMALTCCLLAWP